MNKKKLILFSLPILALVLVSAGLMTYYGQTNAEITVTQSINVAYLDGDEWVDFTGTFFTDELEVTAGEEVDGARIRIENSADSNKKVVISEVVSETGIETDYGWIICFASCPVGSLCAGVGIEGIEVTQGTQIIVPAEGYCSFTIEYTADSMLTDGTYIVKTKIDSAEYTILPAE